MSLSLSARELDELRSTLDTLHSPLRYDSPEAWLDAAMGRVRRLLKADNVHSYVPGLGWRSDIEESARESYFQHYHEYDIAPRLAREQGVPVSTYEYLVGRETFLQGPFYNEWVKPNRLELSHGMSVFVDSPAPSPPSFPYMAVSHRSRSRDRLVDRGTSLLWVLLPAFRAGVRAHLDTKTRRDRLARLFDRMDQQVAVCSKYGRILRINSALKQLLGEEPQRAKLEQAISRAAASVTALSGVEAEPGGSSDGHGQYQVATLKGEYRVWASRLGRQLLHPGSTLVSVEPLFRRLLPEEMLKEQFKLTDREIEVAVLLGEDLTNAEIAHRLGISPHTARHHTESVMRKVNVSSRTAVWRRIAR